MQYLSECAQKDINVEINILTAYLILYISIIFENDNNTIKLFVNFLMSFDVSEYRPCIFHSSTEDHLKEMS